MEGSRSESQPLAIANYLQARIKIKRFSEPLQKIICALETCNPAVCPKIVEVGKILQPSGEEFLNLKNLEDRLRLVDAVQEKIFWVSREDYSLSDLEALKGLPGRLIPVGLLKCECHEDRCLLSVFCAATAV